MSKTLITAYLSELAALKRVSGTNRETVVREAFKDLLKKWGKSLDLTFVPEYKFITATKEWRFVDGALLHTLRVPFGYWEAKDEKDDLDAEIAAKFKKGYPRSNIVFEDSQNAVLFQNGAEVMRCGVEDTEALYKLLRLFFAYERPEIEAFRNAVAQFKEDLPAVLEALRAMIEKVDATSSHFRSAANKFLKHAQEAINPALTDADVREMLIQHILTGEVFAAVFPGTTYHEDNSVARELKTLEQTFFVGNTKHQALKGLAPYYAAIRKAASEISTHHEKQTFLKSIYENFYKVYNPKAADRLGVVYTPNEIVRFMIESADWLCETHFKRTLVDRNVDILDPATGTGTFICELIDRFAGQASKLEQKYLWEMHANEVGILPYYVANLNIEATYAAATGNYVEFRGLCFVDTLDNTYALRKHRGHMDDLFGSVSDDNIKRIRQQNSRRISVIIGNPPYNANQLNERENNKNREYPEIDKRIRETYIDASNAQKTKVYDMYARFFRWASDRLDENGILAFITNRSFLDSRTFDGFRASVAKEFNEIRVVDLGGDVRTNPKLSGTTHNVFGIQTGVAISFMLRKAKQKGCRIFYARRPELETAEEKLAFLGSSRIENIVFGELKPDKQNNWISKREEDSDYNSYVALCDRSTKLAPTPARERAIFKMYTLGVVTNRDDWAYSFDRPSLQRKMEFLIDTYNAEVKRSEGVADRTTVTDNLHSDIKWTRAVKRDLVKGVSYAFRKDASVISYYRPFVKRWLYFDRQLNEMVYQVPQIFGPSAGENIALAFSSEARTDFGVVALDVIPNKDIFMPSAAQVVARFRYENGERFDNITDWALNKFRGAYQAKSDRSRRITKDDIFHYVYAVLHDPVYREQNGAALKRDFPRIPFYSNFFRWADWGAALLQLHLRYGTAPPYALKREDVEDKKAKAAGLDPQVILRASRDQGEVIIDSETRLKELPPQVWEYRLGNRSAVEWILDQYKPSAPRDPAVRARFNDYRFATHKEHVIDLITRLTTVSVETVAIIEAMRKEAR